MGPGVTYEELQTLLGFLVIVGLVSWILRRLQMQFRETEAVQLRRERDELRLVNSILTRQLTENVGAIQRELERTQVALEIAKTDIKSLTARAEADIKRLTARVENLTAENNLLMKALRQNDQHDG